MGLHANGPGRFSGDEVPWEHLIRAAPVLLVLLLGAYLGWHGFYRVEPDEQAVVLRFGKYHAPAGPGLHFMIPVVDKAVLVSVKENVVDLPVSRATRRQTSLTDRRDLRSSEEESLMLTGDLNAEIVEWSLQWEVLDPKKYLFAIAEDHIDATIEAAAQSVMHRLAGDYSIDEMLTAKRAEVEAKAEEATQRLLDDYKCGIQITGLQMQRVTPPASVKPAFDRVNASIQEKVKLVNEANRERNMLIPQAMASKDKLIQDAKGYADRRRAEVQGEIAALLAKFRAYQEAPEITRRRLYLEAMEEVLSQSGPMTVLDSDLKGLVPLLQLQTEANEALPPGRRAKADPTLSTSDIPTPAPRR
jgi:membrane protease subunit HflK